jgi:ribosomal protein S18 acetylase RimI-like enzyme
MIFDDENVLFKAATPQQAKVAATLIYDTDPHLFAYWFGNEYETALKFFETRWRQERSFFSFSLCKTALSGDTLLGIELGYDLKTRTGLESSTSATGAREINPEVLPRLIEALSYIPYLLPPLPEDAYYIAHLSLLPEVRGRGLGTRLLMNAFDSARRQGYRQCQLDVASDNRSVNLYRRLGMEIISETRVIQLENNGVPSHYRMVKQLG